MRSNIDRLVGSAGEKRSIARVGEGIGDHSVRPSTTRSCWRTGPDLAHGAGQGLDAGTAFEILSIDIADVDVGRNIGAQLQMDQAEADLKIARAKAEEGGALAVAREQEMRAAVVEAEAKVPLAMAGEACAKATLA